MPAQVRIFAEDLAKLWSPAEVFTLDICYSGDDYWVLEAGCVNSAGFYGSNLKDFVQAVGKAASLRE